MDPNVSPCNQSCTAKLDSYRGALLSLPEAGLVALLLAPIPTLWFRRCQVREDRHAGGIFYLIDGQQPVKLIINSHTSPPRKAFGVALSAADEIWPAQGRDD